LLQWSLTLIMDGLGKIVIEQIVFAVQNYQTTICVAGHFLYCIHLIFKYWKLAMISKMIL